MSAATLSKALEQWFEHTHANPPASFNPSYCACAGKRLNAVTEAMEAEGYYNNHTREQCAAEIKRRMG
jgi:hypothetical protein